jgi:hypothetical protein
MWESLSLRKKVQFIFELPLYLTRPWEGEREGGRKEAMVIKISPFPSVLNRKCIRQMFTYGDFIVSFI